MYFMPITEVAQVISLGNLKTVVIGRNCDTNY